jgi:hypothetical protein
MKASGEQARAEMSRENGRKSAYRFGKKEIEP